MNLKKLFNFSLDFVIIIALVFLFLFSIVYARERILYTDTATYLYNLTKTAHFQIATNRFVSILPQILPLIGVKLGLPLIAIIYLNSINYILIPIVSVLLCLKLFKDRETAVAILLFSVLMGALLFYYPVSEFQAGLCLLLLYHSFVQWWYKRETKNYSLFIGVSIPLLVTIIFSHPLIIVVFVLWIIWLTIILTGSKKYLLVIPAGLGIVTFIIKEVFFKPPYDTERNTEALDNFKTPLHTYFDSTVAKDSLHFLIIDYYWVYICIGIVLIAFIYKKKWWQLLFFIFTIIGFWCLITISFKTRIYDAYMEHAYQPVSFFMGLVFSYCIFQIIKSKAIITILLASIFVVSFSKINDAHTYFTDRINWYKYYINWAHQEGLYNIAVPANNIVIGVDYSYWASTSESQLLSSMKSPDSTVVLIINANPNDKNKYQSIYPKITKGKYYTQSDGYFILLDRNKR